MTAIFIFLSARGPTSSYRGGAPPRRCCSAHSRLATAQGCRARRASQRRLLARIQNRTSPYPLRQPIDAAGESRRPRAHAIGEPQRARQRVAAKNRDEEAGVESVAGAGGVDDPCARRRRAHVDAAADDAAAVGTELDDDGPGRATPSIDG